MIQRHTVLCAILAFLFVINGAAHAGDPVPRFDLQADVERGLVDLEFEGDAEAAKAYVGQVLEAVAVIFARDLNIEINVCTINVFDATAAYEPDPEGAATLSDTLQAYREFNDAERADSRLRLFQSFGPPLASYGSLTANAFVNQPCRGESVTTVRRDATFPLESGSIDVLSSARGIAFNLGATSGQADTIMSSTFSAATPLVFNAATLAQINASLEFATCDEFGPCGVLLCSAGNAPNESDDACEPCDIGTFSVDGTACAACPPGQFTNVTASTSCQQCPPDRVSEANRAGCELCPEGTVPNGEQSACEACPAGSVVNGDGTGCVACPPGRQPNSAGTACNLCEPGTVSPDGVACVECAAGTYAAESGAATCNACECGRESVAGGAFCTICPPGTYSTQGGVCQPCPEGTDSVEAGACSCEALEGEGEGMVEGEGEGVLEGEGEGTAEGEGEGTAEGEGAAEGEGEGVAALPTITVSDGDIDGGAAVTLAMEGEEIRILGFDLVFNPDELEFGGVSISPALSALGKGVETFSISPGRRGVVITDSTPNENLIPDGLVCFISMLPGVSAVAGGSYSLGIENASGFVPGQNSVSIQGIPGTLSIPLPVEGEGEGGAEGEGEGQADGEGEAEGEPVYGALPIHSGDPDSSKALELDELLRVIQFYNASGIFCAADPESTEDGYEPGEFIDGQTCRPHASDYNPQDWVLSLSELLRAIQFFSSGGYRVLCGTEDGYAAGQGEDEPCLGPLSSDVQTILNNNCAGCHIGGTSGGLDLTDVNTVVGQASASANMLRITAGSPDNSYLWRKLEGTHLEVDGGSGQSMPPGAPLEQGDLDIIAAWILTGAPE